MSDRHRDRSRRALVSVYDKTGLDELARGLHAAGVEIVSTGSTAARIADAGRARSPRSRTLTGFPECLDGRVKTLHPRVHAGILADLRKPDARGASSPSSASSRSTWSWSNLYPFAATVASGAAPDECVEQIDIGGPAMVRAAAKNHASVAVVTSTRRATPTCSTAVRGGRLHPRAAPAPWPPRRSRTPRPTTSRSPPGWAACSPTPPTATGFPAWVGATWERADRAALRREPAPARGALPAHRRRRPGQAEQLHGKEMSYNNYVDADAAWRAAYDHAEPAVAIIKHANPCGIAVGADVAEAHRKAHACDPVSAFGGVIAANRPVTAAMAEQVAEIFTEVVVAPGFEPEALEILTRKKNIRLLRLPAARRTADQVEFRPIRGGLLLQTAPTRSTPPATTRPAGRWRPATPPTRRPWPTCAFAWRACRSVKSNAILLADDGAAVGVGMGQVNRVDSARLAVARAGEERARGAVAASDAFFPFADGLRGAASRPGCARSCSPAGRCATTRCRGRRGGRGHDVLHRHPALLPLIAAAPPGNARRRGGGRSPAVVAARRASEREPAQRSLA